MMRTFHFEMEAGGAQNFVALKSRRLQVEAEMRQLGIVNSDAFYAGFGELAKA
jgi:hypothetical protein